MTITDVDTTDVVTASVDSVSVTSGTTSIDNSTLISMLTVTPTKILDSTENSDTLTWSFDAGADVFDYLAKDQKLVLEYSVKAQDDSGVSATDSDSSKVTITITGTNDAPVVDLDASNTTDKNFNTTFIGGATKDAIAIGDTDTSVSDVDDEYIESATIKLTNQQLNDILVAGTLPNGITASAYDSTTGLLTLTSNTANTMTKSDYQTAIQAIKFDNDLDDPNQTDRTIEVTVNDGDVDSNTAISTIKIADLVNDSADVYESDMADGTAPNGIREEATGNIFTNDALPDGASLSDMSITGGTVDNSVTGQITITTAEGNVLVVNSDNTSSEFGDYTYTLNTAMNNDTPLFFETFDTDVNGWTNAIHQQSMTITQDEEAEKTITGTANTTVNVSFGFQASGNWDTSGDYFKVKIDDIETTSTEYKASNTAPYSFDVTLDGNGEAKVSLIPDGSSSSNNEGATITNFSVNNTVDMETGWSNTTLTNPSLYIPQGTTVSKTFTSTENAGKMVNIDFDSIASANWDANSDNFVIKANGTSYDLTRYYGDDSLQDEYSDHHSFPVQLDANGEVTIELQLDSSTTSDNKESMSIDNFNITLLNENSVDSFEYTVTGDNGFSEKATLDVTVHDDTPSVGSLMDTITIGGGVDTNLLFVLDRSSSMDDDPFSSTDKSYFTYMTESVNNLIDKYGDMGNVNVKVIGFYADDLSTDDDGTDAKNELISNNYDLDGVSVTPWMTLADAKSYLSYVNDTNDEDSSDANNIFPYYGTYYDNGVDGAIDYFDNKVDTSDHSNKIADTAPTGSSLQTIAYFMSDGQPTDANDKNTYIPKWNNFVDDKVDRAVTVMFGEGAGSEEGEQILGDMASSGVPIVVSKSNTDQLSAELIDTVYDKVGSFEIFNSTTDLKFGGDTGNVFEVEYVNSAGETLIYTYDTNSTVQAIDLKYGELYLDFDTGDYVYRPLTLQGTTENLKLRLIDSDHDTDNGTFDLTITVESSENSILAYNDEAIDMSTGKDTLVIDKDATLTTTDYSNIENIEVLDLTKADVDLNNLTVSAVEGMTDSDNKLTIMLNDGDEVDVDNIEATTTNGAWKDDGDGVYSSWDTPTTQVTFVGGDSGAVIDGIIEGLYYETSSGFKGYTQSDGGFNYLDGDEVIFKLGDLVVGSMNMSDTSDDKVFLQDLAQVDRTDMNDEYVENMAVLLQSLDSDSSDNIVITQEMRDAFVDSDIDLATMSEEELVEVIEEVGRTAVSEEDAMEHVGEMLEEYDGVEEGELDERVADEEELEGKEVAIEEEETEEIEEDSSEVEDEEVEEQEEQETNKTLVEEAEIEEEIEEEEEQEESSEVEDEEQEIEEDSSEVEVEEAEIEEETQETEEDLESESEIAPVDEEEPLSFDNEEDDFDFDSVDDSATKEEKNDGSIDIEDILEPEPEINMPEADEESASEASTPAESTSNSSAEYTSANDTTVSVPVVEDSAVAVI